MKKFFFVSTVLLSTLAQADINIVVTPNRVPTEEDLSPTSTTVITEDQIEASQKLTVGEVLESVPGLQIVSQGGLGKQTSVFLRGAKSEHTLVFIDGIEVNDPSSPARAFDFANVSLENIERIEVVRGPQSVLYGSDAIGGVIQIFTKKYQSDSLRSRNTLSGGYGSFNTHEESIQSSISNKKYSMSLGLSHLATDGISSSDEDDNPNAEKDPYQLATLQSNVSFFLNEETEINIFGRYQNSKNEIDDFGGAGGDDPNFHSDERDYYAGLNAKTRWKFYQPILGFSYSHINRDLNDQPNATDPTLYVSEFIGTDIKPSLLHQFIINDQHNVVVGQEYERENFESTSNFGDSPNVSAYHFGNFLQYQYLNRYFHGTAGIRLEKDQDFGTNITYKISPGFSLPSTGTSLNLNYATGFKAPTLFQLNDTFSGNPNLEPDESRSYDITLEQKILKNNLIGATFFHNQFDETIEFDFTSFTYQNIGESNTKGFEFYARMMPLNNLVFNAQWTLTYTEDESTGQDLLRRPKHRGEFDIQYRVTPRFQVGGDYVFVGSRLDVGTVTLPSYSLVGLRAAYDILTNLQLLARVDNILDKNYQEVLGFGTPGINWFSSLRYNF